MSWNYKNWLEVPFNIPTYMFNGTQSLRSSLKEENTYMQRGYSDKCSCIVSDVSSRKTRRLEVEYICLYDVGVIDKDRALFKRRYYSVVAYSCEFQWAESKYLASMCKNFLHTTVWWIMEQGDLFKVAATSLKLEIRLHAHTSYIQTAPNRRR